MVFLCRGSYHLQTIRNSSFPIWIPFISLFSLIAVAKASRNMLNSSGESGHPFLVPDCRGNVFSFSPLRIMFAVVLSFVAFMMLSYVPFLPAFWYVINGCWILSKPLSALIEIIIWLLSFSLLIWCFMLIDLWILKNPCIPGIKHTWSWCIVFLIRCWILFARIFLRIFCICVHQWYCWAVFFFFFFCGIFGFGIRVMVAS